MSMMLRTIKLVFHICAIIMLSSCVQVDDGPSIPVEGVYLSEQTATSAMGEPCHYLVRFYKDGVVIHSGICTDSIEAGWPEINQWFQRDSTSALARGTYVLKGNKISFSVSAHFAELNHDVMLNYQGEYGEEGLLLNLFSETTGEKWAGMKWSRLELGEQ